MSETRQDTQPDEDKDGHVVIVLMPHDSGPVIVSQPITAKMEKRIWRLLKEILPEKEVNA